MKKFIKISTILLMLMLSITPLPLKADSPLIIIDVPSDLETSIISGRSFYVNGTIENYTYTEGDIFSIQVIDKNNVNNIVREVSSNTITPDIFVDKSQGLPMFFDGVSEIDIKTSGMPDLIYDKNMSESFKNGDIKCYFDNHKFNALITGGSVPIGMSDTLGFKDKNKADYQVISDGDYIVKATLKTKEGILINNVEKEIKIKNSENMILARFSPAAQMEEVTKFANEHKYRIYLDPFPGYYNFLNKFCEIAPEWRANDALEYTKGKVHFVIYNVKKSSTTYAVELGVIQKMNDINNPDRLVSYYYSTGEPTLINNQKGMIKAFDENDKIEFVRAEISDMKSQDGVYDLDVVNKKEYDMNVKDGVSAKVNEIVSFYGVSAPIQLDASDIVSNTDNTYSLNNKIKTLEYHITGLGIDKTMSKEVILNRKKGSREDYSELEFKHNLEITKEMQGKKINVEVKGYDTYHNFIAGSEEAFVINVENEKAEKIKGPNANDASQSSVLYVMLIMSLSAICFITKRSVSKEN